MPSLAAWTHDSVQCITGSRHYRSMPPPWRMPNDPIRHFINGRYTSDLKPLLVKKWGAEIF
jgi:hypothetical protein